MLDYVVKGGTLVLPSGLVEADLGVNGERFAAIGLDLKGAHTVDARGLWVLPGIVDPHVHPIHAENYESVSRAAAYGGVTTLVHHLYTPIDGAPLPYFEAEREAAAATSLLDFAFHVRLTNPKDTVASIPPLVSAGSPSFKVFMAYGGRGIMLDDAEIYQVMAEAAQAGAVVLVHAENGLFCEMLERDARRAKNATLLDFFASRPRWVEAEAVNRALVATRLTRCRTYIVHVTCQESLTPIVSARRAGLPVYAETCPHYLLLTAEEVAAMGSRAKMAPPLRERADVEALWRAIEAGIIDAVGSDHSAFVPDEKDANPSDIFAAGFGVPGIEHMMPLLYDRGVAAGRLSMSRLMDVMAARPASILGLSARKGSLTPGSDADMVLFDPKAPFRIENSSLHGSAYYSLYDQWRGHGKVRAVYQRGMVIMQDGELLAQPGTGRWVSRELPRTKESMSTISRNPTHEEEDGMESAGVAR